MRASQAIAYRHKAKFANFERSSPLAGKLQRWRQMTERHRHAALARYCPTAFEFATATELLRTLTNKTHRP
jgi:hypothetical protein